MVPCDRSESEGQPLHLPRPTTRRRRESAEGCRASGPDGRAARRRFQGLAHVDPPDDMRLVLRDERDVMRAHSDDELSRRGKMARLRLKCERAAGERELRTDAAAGAAPQVHGRRADESGHEHVRRPAENTIGAPTCSMAPSRMTATRVPRVIASSWSCVT